MEPFSSDGLQQPLEDYGQDGYGGKVTCSMQEQEFSVHIGADMNWFDLELFRSFRLSVVYYE